jgi:hypothetical protein
MFCFHFIFTATDAAGLAGLLPTAFCRCKNRMRTGCREKNPAKPRRGDVLQIYPDPARHCGAAVEISAVEPDFRNTLQTIGRRFRDIGKSFFKVWKALRNFRRKPGKFGNKIQTRTGVLKNPAMTAQVWEMIFQISKPVRAIQQRPDVFRPNAP